MSSIWLLLLLYGPYKFLVITVPHQPWFNITKKTHFNLWNFKRIILHWERNMLENMLIKITWKIKSIEVMTQFDAFAVFFLQPDGTKRIWKPFQSYNITHKGSKNSFKMLHIVLRFIIFFLIEIPFEFEYSIKYLSAMTWLMDNFHWKITLKKNIWTGFVWDNINYV